MHVHVQSPKGEAKFWMEPELRLAANDGFSMKDLNLIASLIKEHADEIRRAWQKHFKG